MLRKCLLTAGVGALVAMAIGGASFASASSGEGGGRTIVVIEKTTSQRFLDLGQPGPSAGDEFFFGSQFWNLAQITRSAPTMATAFLRQRRSRIAPAPPTLPGGRSSSRARRLPPPRTPPPPSPAAPAP